MDLSDRHLVCIDVTADNLLPSFPTCFKGYHEGYDNSQERSPIREPICRAQDMVILRLYGRMS